MNQNNNQQVEKNYNTLKNYIITAVIGFIIMGLVVAYLFHNHYEQIKSDYMQLFTVFSDGFFTAGVLVGGIGALVLISGEGFFDLLTYSISLAAKYIFTSKERRYKESYVDYKLRKEGEREGVKISFIAIVGAIYLVIGFLLALPMWI